MTRRAASRTVANASKSRSLRSSPLSMRSRNSTVLCRNSSSVSASHSSASAFTSGTSDCRARIFLPSPTFRILENTVTETILPGTLALTCGTPDGRWRRLGRAAPGDEGRSGPEDDLEGPARLDQALQQRVHVQVQVSVEDQVLHVARRVQVLVIDAPVGGVERVGPLVDVDPVGEVAVKVVAGAHTGVLRHHRDGEVQHRLVGVLEGPDPGVELDPH